MPVVLCVARFVEKKGIDTLLEALALLASRGVDFRCELIGEGPLRQTLEHLAQQLNLTQRVVFLGGATQISVAAALEGATVFALPCRQAPDGDQDGMPNVLIEAMAVGVPVVGGDAGGVAEAVDHERSGLLVPSNAPTELAEALERVLSDPALRHRLVEGGLARTARADIRVAAQELRSLFGAIASPHRAAR